MSTLGFPKIGQGRVAPGSTGDACLSFLATNDKHPSQTNLDGSGLMSTMFDFGFLNVSKCRLRVGFAWVILFRDLTVWVLVSNPEFWRDSSGRDGG